MRQPANGDGDEDGDGGALPAALDPRTAGRALADMTAAHLLQRAIRGERYDLYEQFAKLVNERPTTELHDLLELVPAGPPVPLDEVEPVSEITRRFSTGAMSHGALGKEAHETLAEAMNLIGARANCGEGGEDPYRYRTRGLDADRNSRIKQIASGRFGVTPEYVAHADELQDQDGPGLQAGRGRPAARPQGDRRDRPAAPHPARRHRSSRRRPTTTSTPSRTSPSSSTTSSRSTAPRSR